MEPPQGTGSPQEPQGSAAPEVVNIDEKINKAITSRFKAFEKQFESKISDGFNRFGTSLEEKLAALAPQKAEDRPQSIEDDPRWKGVQKEIAGLKAQNERAAAERDAERAKSRDVALRQKLTEALGSAGIDASRIKHAQAWLVDATKAVRYADGSDDVVYRDADGSEVDLSSGVRAWLKSDDGKLYMPPRGAIGSGDRPGGVSPRTHGQPPSREELGEAVARALGAL